MIKKNDLSGVLKKRSAASQGVLQEPVKEVAKAPNERPATRSKKGSVGGRPKVADKRSEKITLSLTKSEAQTLKAKAGMVPQAAFVLSKLHEAGFFDDKK